MTKASFHSNMPSLRYFAGFDDHSMNPLAAWQMKPIQMIGIIRLMEVYGIVRKNPIRRSAIMNITPMMTALPKAWNVRASGQPHDSLTHVAIDVDSSQSSMFSLL